MKTPIVANLANDVKTVSYEFLRRDLLVPAVKKEAKEIVGYFNPTTPIGIINTIGSSNSAKLAQKIDFYW